MSDQTPMPERDDSGRFVSTRAATRHEDNREEWHPLARILFGWTASPKAGAAFFWGGLLVSGLLILGDALVKHHPKFEIEHVFGFYAWWGFGAFAFVVLMGWPLGRLLRRGENYYGDADADDDQEKGGH